MDPSKRTCKRCAFGSPLVKPCFVLSQFNVLNSRTSAAVENVDAQILNLLRVSLVAV